MSNEKNTINNGKEKEHNNNGNHNGQNNGQGNNGNHGNGNNGRDHKPGKSHATALSYELE